MSVLSGKPFYHGWIPEGVYNIAPVLTALIVGLYPSNLWWCIWE